MRTPATRARRLWDMAAPAYDPVMRPVEWLLDDRRRWIGAHATGRVLEVAIGTGRNLPYYPADVQITAVEISPAMAAVARQRAARLGQSIDLCEGDAQALPFTDGAFDTVVCTLGLCGVPDERIAIAELARVVRPGGRLLLLDHVASRWWPLRTVQWLIERITIPLANEHFTRRPRALLANAGFDVVSSRRSAMGSIEQVHARRVIGPAHEGGAVGGVC